MLRFMIRETGGDELAFLRQSSPQDCAIKWSARRHTSQRDTPT
jgi:hypothetical protein